MLFLLNIAAKLECFRKSRSEDRRLQDMTTKVPGSKQLRHHEDLQQREAANKAEQLGIYIRNQSA